jgi:Domain of unknown function (DUF4314)
MRYRMGQRIALEHTDDPHTQLRPGDEGSVIGHDEATHTVDIAWDSGSRLSMCLDAGDRIRILPTTDDSTTDESADDTTGEEVR